MGVCFSIYQENDLSIHINVFYHINEFMDVSSIYQENAETYWIQLKCWWKYTFVTYCKYW